ncbi:metalloprotease [Psychroserpens algicola]|uniref:Metalloprotease n=1 Tax=Psychroserpens algicola TaxID=1719034 RepID=A0ABT0H6U7_9FLAO|nr:metalloprotease [Psychroserpens algicola]MCK8479739.1 metalloprotease [Psychroserpens algicola]
MPKRLIPLLISLWSLFTFSQNSIDLKASVDIDAKTIKINQRIRYQNESNDTLSVIYLNDWNNAYSTKKTPLAKRFTEEFSDKFHFAKSEQRGFTVITKLDDEKGNALEFSDLKNHPDVIKVNLNTPLLPNESYDIKLTYDVVLPDDNFTGYGISPDKDLNLKYWYITPAVYNGDWQYYSNKNLDDLYIPKADLTFEIEFPLNYQLVSELNTTNVKQTIDKQSFFLYGKNRVNTHLILTKFSQFKFVQTDNFTIFSDLSSEGVTPEEKALITDKITRFISEHLAAYPHERLLITKNDYKKDPLYGLNQLPDFILPFPDNFQYELKLLKTALNNYLENTLLINPRKDYWLRDGVQIYYLMKYVELHYPDTKLLGKLANVWGIRSFHAADLGYNDQFNLFYMQMARTNRDQPLTTSKDSLIKFNSNIAGKYKAGIGLRYLDDYVNADVLETTISEYLENNQLKITSSNAFEQLLKSKTDKDINWFFTDYIDSSKKIDFKIKTIKKTEDSITITIKNKRKTNVPVSLFALRDDSIVSKSWIENVGKYKSLTIPRDSLDKLVLNYDNVLPEFNLRDNYKSLKGSFITNKPFQFRLFKDIEDPNYNQVFIMPQVEFRNIYDGLTLGAKFYNKSILRKKLNYRFSPVYATKSKSLTGSSSIFYTHNIEGTDLFNITYGMIAKYNAFAEDSFVTILTPNISFSFRDNDNFRSNQRRFLNLRYVGISREVGENAIIEDLVEPDYNVINLRYINTNPGLVDFYKWFYDVQFANNFGKVAVNYEYRKLSENNRQFNLRLFAGTFLYNNTDPASDYFSFALDRPTDYLFDYNYLGRSEDSGIFSQQIIIAEGGFKSKLKTPFANQWMTTANVSTTIWRYIEAYGDIGLVKNKGFNPAFVYDSGIKVDLVTDFFELYFPVYSNLGWEIAQPNYDQKIRIKFTVDPQILLGLFRRKWY